MKTKSLFAFGLAAVGLAGCGGGPANSGGSLNLYAGTWTGPWSAGNDTGTATLHFTGIGSVSGTIVDDTTKTTYQVTGSITNPSLHSTQIDLTEASGGQTISFDGTITLKAGKVNEFTGSLTQIAPNGTVQTIDLTFMSF